MQGKITNRKLAEIKLCCAAGMTATETAHRIGVSDQAIRYWAKRCDLEFFKRRGTRSNLEARAHEAEARLRETMNGVSGNFTHPCETPSYEP